MQAKLLMSNIIIDIDLQNQYNLYTLLNVKIIKYILLLIQKTFICRCEHMIDSI